MISEKQIQDLRESIEKAVNTNDDSAINSCIFSVRDYIEQYIFELSDKISNMELDYQSIDDKKKELEKLLQDFKTTESEEDVDVIKANIWFLKNSINRINNNALSIEQLKIELRKIQGLLYSLPQSIHNAENAAAKIEAFDIVIKTLLDSQHNTIKMDRVTRKI